VADVGRAAPLRVAFVNTSLDIGGIERQMLALASGLPRDEFVVEFVLVRGEGSHGPWARTLGAPVHVVRFERVWDRPLVLAPLRLARRAVQLVRFVRLLRRRRYDVVHAWQFQAYVLCGLTRPLTRVPVLIAGRRTLSDSTPRSGPVWRWLAGLATQAADAIVANSEAVRRDVARHEGLDPSSIRVIRNGVERRDPSPERRAAARAGWAVGDAEVVIGCVANFRPEKALDALVRVAEAVTTANPAVRFVLVGDGPTRSRVGAAVASAALSDRVLLPGHVPDARSLLDGFDVYVHPSDSESLPNAILEAAAAGLPIVATDVGGIGEILDHRRSGLLVRPRDETSLRTALDELIASPGLRRELGDAARAAVAAEFPMARMIDAVAALQRELAAAKGIAARRELREESAA